MRLARYERDARNLSVEGYVIFAINVRYPRFEINARFAINVRDVRYPRFERYVQDMNVLKVITHI